MPSIVLSFVGSQDPFGNKTGEGSIVSLLRGLRAKQIKVVRVILLYTEGERGTSKNAIDTKIHLETDPDLKDIIVEIYPVSKELSDDPTDLSKAIEEAKIGLSYVHKHLKSGDHLEFNASSGTPAMKATFSVFQVAKYITESRVWQIRDPDAQQDTQERVFESNLSGLRREFDLQILLQLIDKYNYVAALGFISLSEIKISSEILDRIKVCSLWNQGQFEEFYDQAEEYLDSSQKNRKKEYWWQAYEQAYIAIVRLKQGNTVEAMLHSYRAVEGLIYLWAKHELKSYIFDKKDEYLLLQKTILDQYPNPELQEKFDEFAKNGKLQMRGKEQSILINHIILNGQKNADFDGWDNEEARRLRNVLSHKLGGISQKEIFNAWCQYKKNKQTGMWESKNDIHKPEHWQKRLLNCINIISGQNFSSFQQASLFPIIHHQIQKKIESYQV